MFSKANLFTSIYHLLNATTFFGEWWKFSTLRATIGSLEAIRSKTRQHAGKAVELHTVELRS